MWRFGARRDGPPLLLFDFDGVIADSQAVFFREFTSVCTELGFGRINNEAAFLALFDGNLVKQLIRAGFPLRRLRELAEQFAPRIREATQGVEPFPGMTELIQDLAGRHPVYIITSNATETIEAFFARHDIQGVRDIIGADKETSKVKKIRRIRRQHPKHTAYYIGDTKGDMLEARRARALPVAALWGWHSPERLAEGRPAYTVASPEALRQLFEARA